MTDADLKLHALFEALIRIDPSFADERGEIANILSDIDLSHVAIITSAAGSVRGNHWHPMGTGLQYMYLIAGSYLAFAQDPNDPDSPLSMQRVTPRTLAVCPPGLAHAYRFAEPSVFLNIGTDDRDAARFADHTIPFALLSPAGDPVGGGGIVVAGSDDQPRARGKILGLDGSALS
jgi:dTDP-4-dehydrorhamnose 3,5-epimerase-like enzyme